MTTSTAKASPLDSVAWMLKARRQAARIRELRVALLEARHDIAAALVVIEGLREQVAALERINAQHEEVLRRVIHEREQALHEHGEGVN